jgi:hypothetical protein
MLDSVINDQQRMAIIERIACHTVGIAVENNTAVGTGTLVTTNGEHFVITAEHVIKGADARNIRFWCRPPAPIIEKAARDLTRTEIGRLTPGEIFPIETVTTDSDADLAAIKIAPDFTLAKPNEFYRLSESTAFAAWPEDQLDDLSLIYFGFPTANSLPLGQVGDKDFRFIGCAHGISNYDKALNEEGWKSLPLSFSSEKDFLLKYNLSQENITPQGFSGCGVWVGSLDPNSLIWSSEPLLVGMIYHHFPRKSILAATKISRILQATR